MKNLQIPRALHVSIRFHASADNQALLNQSQTTLSDMRNRNGARLDGLEETVLNLIGDLNDIESRDAVNVGDRYAYFVTSF
ncbi:hypothetical protein HUO14_03735 [Parasphingorhabdus flavimaris]|uniref:Uncharacterized protein n=1 Tax=Parasphingorhabdus flavimaris TaxID=266812 RepID=A0ABX2N013_9SPHN|nr:hypothetical protein [Parasphingorhabdus flavimaris]NVD27019.1 hypothetical protein [Parasphingorhabdus flavimaris]